MLVSVKLPVDDTTATTRFVLALSQALHEHGTPAHQLEQSLARVATALGLPSAQFLSTPTALHMAVGDGAGQHVYLRRSTEHTTDLAALDELDAIVDEASEGRLSAVDGERRLAALRKRPPRHGPRARRWASAAASATAAVFLGGGGLEVIVSAVAGLAVGVLAQLTAGRPRARALHEPLAALLISALVTLLAAMLPGLGQGVVLVSALIMLMPGLTLTVAMTELAGGHVVSGSSRLAGAMTALLTMLFGAALGRQLAMGVPLPELMAAPELTLPAGTWLAALAASTTSFTVLLGARPRDAIWIAVACGLGYGAARMGAASLGPELGAFVGAIAVGVASNAFSRALQRPATLMRLPGLLMLVPGSLGFRSLGSLLEADTVAGADGLFRVALVTVALAIGMFGADLLVTPRRSL